MTPQTQPLPVRELPSMEEIYNLLMGSIEPDLTTDMLPFLEEIYAGESAEEAEDRKRRYEEAFQEFAEKFDKALAIWKEQILRFKAKAFAMAQERVGKEDAQALSDIEHSFDLS